MRIRYSTTLDEKILEELKIRAIKEKKRINDILEQAIKEYLEKTIKDPPKPQK
jgi:hypothetical protein